MSLAQVEEPVEVAEETSSFAISGFVGPDYRFTATNREWAHFLGVKAGILLNHHFVVGAAGYGLANAISADVPRERDLIFNYGGLLLEWIVLPMERVHGVFSLLVGQGIIDLDGQSAAGDIVGVGEPQWIFQTNVTPFLQADLGLGYRMILSREKDYLRGYWDASQFFIGVGLRFGKFKIDYDP